MQQVEAINPVQMPAQIRAPLSLAWLGVVPFFSFAALFLLIPTRLSRGRRLPGQRRPFHAGQSRGPLGAQHPQCVCDQPRSQRRFRGSRRGAGLRPGLGGRARRPAGLAAARPHDIQRRGVELRRPAARLRVHRHAGTHGPRHHHPAERLRLRALPGGLQHPELLGPDHHLSVFPDSLDGADPNAGARRVEAGMARGRDDPGEPRRSPTGATS